MDFYIDTAAKCFWDYNLGQALHNSLKPRLVYGTKATFTLHIGSYNGTAWVPQVLTETDGWNFGVDTNFLKSDSLMLFTDSSSIVDDELGILQITVSCLTTSFDAKITAENTSAHVELWRIISGVQDALPEVFLQDTVYCNPSILAGAGAPEDSDPVYLTRAQTLAILASATDTHNRGYVATTAELPTTGVAGDYCIVGATDTIWIYDTATFAFKDSDTKGQVTRVNGAIGDVTITPTSLGLGNVDNTKDIDKPVSTATQNALDGKVDKVSGKGLSSNDYTDQEKAQLLSLFDGGVSGTSTTYNALVSSVENHIADEQNPHNVSAAHLGLGDVDNTSDLNKPVSTATQAALDTKANASVVAAHTGDTSNPHIVTPAQVGNATAQWNADKLQGRAVASTAPADKQGMVWNATNSQWEPGAAGHMVQDAGTSKTARSKLNFTGFTVADDATNDATNVTLPTTSYTRTFTSANLVSSILTVNHNLGDSGALVVAIKDNGGNGIGYPTGITYTSSNALTVDFSGITITGTWTVSVIKAGGVAAGTGAGMWELVERWEPTAATTSHTFSGLNGDSDRRYMIVSNVVANGATGQYFARLNNDAAGNYSARAFDGYGASTFENDRQTWTGICIGYTGDADQTADVAHIWAKSGRYRFCQIDSMRIASNLAQEIGRFGVVWANTADNITSLVLAAPGGGNFGVGSYVELWKLSNGSAGSSTAVSSDYTAILNGTTFYTLYTAPFYKPTTVTSLLNTDLCYDTSTKYYTCPVAGVYEITTWVSMGNNSARCVFALFKNDVNTAETYDIGAYYHNLSSSYCVSCEAGDTLLVVLSKDSGLAVPNDFQLKFKKIN